MMLGQGKNPGHSGTDHKHRKAFAALRRWKKGKGGYRKEANAQLPREDYQLTTTRPSGKVPGFILTALCAGGLYFLGALLIGVGENYVSGAWAAVPEYTVEEEEAYHYLVTSGWRNFERGGLKNAYLEFNQALQIKLDGKEAHLGIAQTLEQFCMTEGKYCEEAERKKEFMVKTYHKNKDDTIL